MHELLCVFAQSFEAIVDKSLIDTLRYPTSRPSTGPP